MTTTRQEGVQPGDDVRGEPMAVEALSEEAATAETAENGAGATVEETAAITGEAVTQAIEGQEAVEERVKLMIEEVIPAAETSFEVDKNPDYRSDCKRNSRTGNAPDDLPNYFESWVVFGGKLAHAAAGKVIGKLIEKEKGLTREQGFPGHRQAFIRAIVEMLGENYFKDPYNAFEVLKDVIDTFGLRYAIEILKQKARVAKLPKGDEVIAYADAKLREDSEATAQILRDVETKFGKEAKEKLHVDVWNRERNLGLR